MVIVVVGLCTFFIILSIIIMEVSKQLLKINENRFPDPDDDNDPNPGDGGGGANDNDPNPGDEVSK